MRVIFILNSKHWMENVRKQERCINLCQFVNTDMNMMDKVKDYDFNLKKAKAKMISGTLRDDAS